jgi:hypothetical protein
MTNLLDIKVVIFKYSYDISISILVYSLEKMLLIKKKNLHFLFSLLISGVIFFNNLKVQTKNS